MLRHPPISTRTDTLFPYSTLFRSVIFEIAVAISAVNAQGFTRPWWTISTLASGAIATFFLSLALLTFDLAVGYAIWTSVAGVGVVLLGALFFGQRLHWKKFMGIFLVIGGVAGLGSYEHTSELQSLIRISYHDSCL